MPITITTGRPRRGRGKLAMRLGTSMRGTRTAASTSTMAVLTLTPTLAPTLGPARTTGAGMGLGVVAGPGLGAGQVPGAAPEAEQGAAVEALATTRGRAP
jgi:hypothetical protein